MSSSRFVDMVFVIDTMCDYYGGYNKIPREIIKQLDDIMTEHAIECSELLKEADHQEKIGFIQTAETLRRLVNNYYNELERGSNHG